VQEFERAKIIEACLKGAIKANVAALRLQISLRQVRRLQKRFVEAGVDGMVSERRGKPSNNQLAPGVAQTALQIVREHYSDFGPTHACEKLKERHGLVLSKETLRHLMIEAGLRPPSGAKRPALHQPRERRACVGELVQIDGSRHRWFEERGEACTLLVYVDDATGRILHLHFAETGSTASYFEATRRYLEKHGKPQAFYADRAAVFRSASPNRRAPTQFQRAVDELGIKLICARSPEAKGRVERANRTLQERMVKDMRLDGIDNIEEANKWCSQFVQWYNGRYGCVPRSQLDAHLPIGSNDDLARILSMCETRKLSAKLTVQHGARQYLLTDAPELRALIGQPVNIHTYANGNVELRANDKVLPHATLELQRPAGPTDVDSKTLHHTVDQLESGKRPRDRHYRKNQTAAVVAQGVMAAKNTSAQKRLRST
jgi:transposase